MIRVAALLCVLAQPVAAQSVVIDTAEEARAYIDATFAANGCAMAQADFFAQMQADGVMVTDDDMGFAMNGSEKIIRSRRVLGEMKALFDAGLICEDAADKTLAISKFGGCA